MKTPSTSRSAIQVPSLFRAIGLALLLCCAPPALAQDAATPAPTQEPVPDKDLRATAVAAFKKEFRDALKSKDDADKRSLATSLLGRAATEDDAVRRYVYLDEAASLAEDAGDLRLMLTAIDTLATHFAIERVPRVYDAINGLTRSSKDSGVQAEAATACIDLTGDAIAANDPTTATKAIALAKGLAKKSKMDGIGARAGELAKLVAAFKRLQSHRPAIEDALAEEPSDETAHTGAGRYDCFGAGNWETGLAHFLQCDHEVYRKLAQAEGALESSPERRIEVADGWWAEAQSERDALAEARLLARAALHYNAALQADATNETEEIRARLDSLTYITWNRGVALTTDFSKYGPSDIALATLRDFIADQKIETDKEGWRTKLPRFPDIKYAPGLEYFWHLETNHGAITIRFFTDTAPQHVTNFLYLTELGFFDGLTFHRVIPGFMAQGGDPAGTGSGGPGYFIDGEYEGATDGRRDHKEPGRLSMANTGQPRSDGSQFFITFRPCTELDGKHTVFGEVTDGMKTVKKLEDEGTAAGPPKSKLVIERATVSVR